MKHRTLLSMIGLIGLACLLIGVNMIATPLLSGRQIDLTEQRLFTLSPGTRTILAGLKEPITLRLFYSPALGARIPQYAAHADRVRELLREYAQLAPGKIHLEFHTPEPFSEDEDRATAYGLQGVPLEDGGEHVFFGLQGTNLLDDERAIPFFQPERERFLEYDLSKLVYDLSSPSRPVVGVMTALKMDGDPQAMMMRQPTGAPWAAMMNLRQAFTVKSVATDAKSIDPDIKVLLVAHPQNLSDATLYAIDQFVMRGGRLIAMVAPVNETLGPDPQTGAPPADPSSNLGKLFQAWGIEYDPNQALGDLDGAWKVRGGGPSGQDPIDYVAYFSVRSGINHDDPATADLQEVVVANPGTFSVKPGSGLTVTPLLSSSDHAELFPASEIRQDPNPGRLLDGFKPDGTKHLIAARLRGVLKSAFDKAPDGATDPYRASSDGPANLVVITDTDMLSDRFWTRSQDFFGNATATPFADNGALISNLVGTLSGGDALIGLRSRGSVARPFEVVDAMQRDAEARYRETETALTKHLDETSKKLDDLRGGRDGTQNAALNAQQLAAIEDLKRDAIETRGKLRQVQFELRRDIASLQNRLRLFDIALVPALLLVVGVLMAWVRQARRTRRQA